MVEDDRKRARVKREMADSIWRIARTVAERTDRIELISHAAALDAEAEALDARAAAALRHEPSALRAVK